MKFILIWVAAVLMPTGQVKTFEFKQAQIFDSKRACIEYATDRVERMPDWIRGRLGAPFEVPIRVQRKCVAPGTPT